MTDQIPNNNEKFGITTAKTLAIAIEFGFIIALPLFGLTTLGKWLAVKYDNPLILFGSIIIAIIVSTTVLAIRIYKIYKELIKK